MNEPNRFQKFNVMVLNRLSSHLTVINKKFESIFLNLTKLVLLSVGIVLMLAGSAPFLYLLSSISGMSHFKVLLFIKMILLGIISWYVGYSLSELAKRG